MPERQMTGCRAAILYAVLLLVTNGCSAGNNRLQGLVTNCLDISGEAYCRTCQWPRTDSGCIADNECSRTTGIWREELNYVAIRDRKMCGCKEEGFVHGLAIPRALVSGVESVNRPNGIWEFAWRTALERKIPAGEIGLAINPRHDRSENQMHIHITRLRSDARGKFRQEMSATVKSLNSVWGVADRIAATRGLSDYGVLVAGQDDNGFIVVVDSGSPEDAFMQARCSKGQ